MRRNLVWLIAAAVMLLVLAGCTSGSSAVTESEPGIPATLSPAATFQPTFTPSPTLPVTLTPQAAPTQPEPKVLYQAVPFPAPDEAVYQQALQDIDKYRLGELELELVDGAGNPLPGYRVEYSQVGRDFKFAVWESEPYNWPNLRDLGLDGYFTNLWWGYLERELGIFSLRFSKYFKGVGELASAGLEVMGQDAYSPNSTYPVLPDGDFSSQLGAIERHMNYTVDYMADDVALWEGILEPNYQFNNPYGWSVDQYLDTIETSVASIRRNDPTARILVNQAIPCSLEQDEKIQDILNRGIEFDLLGLQFYYNSYVNPEVEPDFQAPRLSLAAINECIDGYVAMTQPYGIELGPTEMSFPSQAPAGQPGYAGHSWSEDLQAQYFEYLATIFFSKPNAAYNSWFKGTDDGKEYILNGGLVDDDGRPKKVWYVYQDLIRRWTSSGQLELDGAGTGTIKGFGGSYRLVITDPTGRERMVVEAPLPEQQSTTLELTFEPSNPMQAELDSLEQLTQYWLEEGDSDRWQRGRDFLALMAHHLEVGEFELAEQSYQTAVEGLAIPYSFTLSAPTDMKLAAQFRTEPIIDANSHVIWSADVLYHSYDFPTGRVEIKVETYTTPTGGAWPHLVIGVGANYSEIMEVSNLRTETFSFETELTGNEEVLTLRYPEEPCPNIGECKLFIRDVTVNGLSYEPLPPE